MAEAGPPVLQKCCGEKSGGRERCIEKQIKAG